MAGESLPTPELKHQAAFRIFDRFSPILPIPLRPFYIYRPLSSPSLYLTMQALLYLKNLKDYILYLLTDN